MYRLLGSLVSRWWPLVILAWVLVVAVFLVLTNPKVGVLPQWDEITHDGDLAYLPNRMTTVRGTELMAKAFPESRSKSQIAVVFARDDRPLDEADFKVLKSVAGLDRVREIYHERAVKEYRQAEEMVLPVATTLDDEGNQIDAIWTPMTDVVGDKLVSEDKQAAIIVVHLTTEFLAVQNRTVLHAIRNALDEVIATEGFPPGLRIAVSGNAAIGGDMLLAAEESIQRTDIATAVLVVLILAVVYRAPVLVLIPITTIVMSIIVALNVVSLLAQAHLVPGLEWVDFKVFKTTKIFVVTLLFGSGTDFCLFLISRYKEELNRLKDRRLALAKALESVGDAITASALTTVCGLAMMWFADFGKFRNSGPAIAMCLVVAWLACMTLAPALLRAFAWIVFWPLGESGIKIAAVNDDISPDDAKASNRFWIRLSHAIIRRPGLILIASVVFMTPLAYVGARPRWEKYDGTWASIANAPWGPEISYDLLAELSDDRPSVEGTKLLREHFSPGQIGPITVLAFDPDAHFDTPEGLAEIKNLTTELYDIPGVTSVRSLAEPLGERPGRRLSTKELTARRTMQRNPRVKATYLSDVPEFAGRVTRFDVAVNFDPFSDEAAQTLETLDARLKAIAADENSPWKRAHFDFIGTTAGTRDLKAVTESDQRIIQVTVVAAVLAVLLLILRRPLISGYLIFSVLFSYFVTIGLTEMAFRWMFPDSHGLDWKVPIFLFVILIAVGQDYNIYLVTRVFEEQKRRGKIEGLRVAVVQTGGIITSCGVIMAGTFVSMMTGTLRGMTEMGFALTLGIVLDTFVVRTIVVPAFLALLFRFTGKSDDAVQGLDAEEPQESRDSLSAHSPAFTSVNRTRRAAG